MLDYRPAQGCRLLGSSKQGVTQHQQHASMLAKQCCRIVMQCAHTLSRFTHHQTVMHTLTNTHAQPHLHSRYYRHMQAQAVSPMQPAYTQHPEPCMCHAQTSHPANSEHTSVIHASKHSMHEQAGGLPMNDAKCPERFRVSTPLRCAPQSADTWGRAYPRAP
jgi:hypothetical protein